MLLTLKYYCLILILIAFSFLHMHYNKLDQNLLLKYFNFSGKSFTRTNVVYAIASSKSIKRNDFTRCSGNNNQLIVFYFKNSFVPLTCVLRSIFVKKT